MEHTTTTTTTTKTLCALVTLLTSALGVTVTEPAPPTECVRSETGATAHHTNTVPCDVQAGDIFTLWAAVDEIDAATFRAMCDDSGGTHTDDLHIGRRYCVNVDF